MAAAPRLRLPALILELIHKLYNRPEDVESVHSLLEGPPPVNPNRNPRSANQGFLNAAPNGIDAHYAWQRAGGDGSGVSVVDMEQGWNLDHEDLADAKIRLIAGRNSAYFCHGTSVLGELLMVDNTVGGIGIAPSATGRVISQIQQSGNAPAAAIIVALLQMGHGDVLLLEAQEFDPVSGSYFWPVEIADATFEALQFAIALGITVVEAGCNGNYDLDLYVNLGGRRIFARSSQDEGFRESGAIMVGAGSSSTPHRRCEDSNYGSRVDAYAWGENVDTATTDDNGTDNKAYTGAFSGTSSASTIVTGAAVAVQGIAVNSVRHKFSPSRLRAILTTDGTQSCNPAADRIGVMPNLKAIIDGKHINMAPPGMGEYPIEPADTTG